MRSDSTGPCSALLILKVSRLSFSLFCARKSGFGGRGMSFKEISFRFCFDSLSYICDGVNILFPNAEKLELNDSFCKYCPLDEKGELFNVFLSVLK